MFRDLRHRPYKRAAARTKTAHAQKEDIYTLEKMHGSFSVMHSHSKQTCSDSFFKTRLATLLVLVSLTLHCEDFMNGQVIKKQLYHFVQRPQRNSTLQIPAHIRCY